MVHIIKHRVKVSNFLSDVLCLVSDPKATCKRRFRRELLSYPFLSSQVRRRVYSQPLTYSSLLLNIDGESCSRLFRWICVGRSRVEWNRCDSNSRRLLLPIVKFSSRCEIRLNAHAPSQLYALSSRFGAHFIGNANEPPIAMIVTCCLWLCFWVHISILFVYKPLDN